MRWSFISETIDRPTTTRANTAVAELSFLYACKIRVRLVSIVRCTFTHLVTLLAYLSLFCLASETPALHCIASTLQCPKVLGC